MHSFALHSFIHSGAHKRVPPTETEGKLVHRHRYFTRLQAKLMANPQEHPEIEIESHSEHEDLGVQILNPEQLAQENQVLKDKVGAMEAQVHEMMAMLQSLKSGTTAEGVAVVGPDGVASFVPPPVSANATTTVPPGFGVSNPVCALGVNGSNQYIPQIYPWGMPMNYTPSTAEAIPVMTSQPAVVTSSGAAGVPHIHFPSPSIVPPRSSPALALEIIVNPPNAAYQMGNSAQYGGYHFSPGSYPQGQMIESSQPRDRYHLLEERLKAMEAQIHEMMVILQSLKSGTAAEGVAVVGPVGVTSFIPLPPQTVPFSAPVSSQQGGDCHKTQGYQYKRRISFDPIPMTYTELFNHLTSKNLINTRPMKALQPPFSRSYNTSATCSFHENGVGHTVEECRAFKRAVQDLIDRCVVQIGTHDTEGKEEINEEVTTVPVKEGCWDTLGEPSGKFDYLVRYDAPGSAQVRMEDIQPTGWDEEEEQHSQVAIIKDGPESEEGGASRVCRCGAGKRIKELEDC